MKRENHRKLSTMRLIIYGIVILLAIIQRYLHLGIDSLIGLLLYGLFFLATLTLCKSKRRYWFASSFLVFIVLLIIAVDQYAFLLAGAMKTAMLSMKMMTAVTVIQNLVFSLYLLICTGLLWREKRVVTRWLGLGIVIYFAVQLLPATWFTLQFIFSAIVG